MIGISVNRSILTSNTSTNVIISTYETLVGVESYVSIYHYYNTDDMIKFEWNELNGYLSSQDIIFYQIGTNINDMMSNNYLILDANVLISGMKYEFQVTATQYESSNIFGSASVEIVVNNVASVVDESFVIFPNDICNGSIKIFPSFSDAFENFYDISIEANGNEDDSRLYYQFGYIYENERLLFDSSMFQNAFLSGKCIDGCNFDLFIQTTKFSFVLFLDALFPIGEFGIFVNVFDNNVGKLYQSLAECKVMIQDNECIGCT